MISAEYPFDVDMAEEFIVSNRELVTAAPDIACWQPDTNTAIVRHGAISSVALVAARESSPVLTAGIKLEPVIDPALALAASGKGRSELAIDPEGSLDQRGSVVRISASNSETFTKFWERVGASLDFPSDASTEEIGLAAASGIEFGIIRAALARLQA